MAKIKRKLIQFISMFITNGYIKGFFEGKIYRGDSKALCVPGLNCYSCPGALGSCPIGSFQAVVNAAKYNFSFYVAGTLILIGTFFGRLICGFVCPFGLFQELLYKIPSKKIKLSEKLQWLKYLKYIILAVFVILIPIFISNSVGMGDPVFCKYICPAGTLEGGIPLLTINKSLRGAAGYLFLWKLLILLMVIVLSIIIFRPFCRFLCPLGALYGLFNPISIYKMEVDKSKCTNCKACHAKCKLQIKVNETPNSPECIRCGACKTVCKVNAITSSNFKVKHQKDSLL